MEARVQSGEVKGEGPVRERTGRIRQGKGAGGQGLKGI